MDKYFIQSSNKVNFCRLNTSDTLYTNKKWFKKIKSRWGNFYDNLEKHWLKMFFRSRSGGRDQSKFGDGVYDDIYLRRYEHFPEYYRYDRRNSFIFQNPPIFKELLTWSKGSGLHHTLTAMAW